MTREEIRQERERLMSRRMELLAHSPEPFRGDEYLETLRQINRLQLICLHPEKYEYILQSEKQWVCQDCHLVSLA